MKQGSYEKEKRKAWEERYGDDDEPLVSWEEFDEWYTECPLCGDWDRDQCVCYAR